MVADWSKQFRPEHNLHGRSEMLIGPLGAKIILVKTSPKTECLHDLETAALSRSKKKSQKQICVEKNKNEKGEDAVCNIQA